MQIDMWLVELLVAADSARAVEKLLEKANQHPLNQHAAQPLAKEGMTSKKQMPIAEFLWRREELSREGQRRYRRVYPKWTCETLTGDSDVHPPVKQVSKLTASMAAYNE